MTMMDMMLLGVLLVVALWVIITIWKDMRPQETAVEKELRENAERILNEEEKFEKDIPPAWPFPTAHEKMQETSPVKPKRAKDENGKFIADDPSTPENEAWEGGKAPAKPKAKRKPKATTKKATTTKKSTTPKKRKPKVTEKAKQNP